MKIQKSRIISWEPLEIKFVPEKKKKYWDKDIFTWLQSWEKDRLEIAKSLETSQLPLEYYIAGITSDGTVVVHIEWLCEKSLDIFTDYIQKNSHNIKELIIGDEIDEVESHDRMGLKIHYIKIPQKIIYTETQRDIKVSSFEISKYPISVGQYKNFAEETNYKTTNEKKGYYLTYCCNDLLIGLSKKEIEASAATCLSYNDAIEYCKWAGVRIPSDHEWLSAAILDWTNEYKSNDISEELVQKCATKKSALKNLSYEWTCEYIKKSDSAFVREGPGYLLEKGWRKKKQRKKHSSKFTDLLLQFRVCKK